MSAADTTPKPATAAPGTAAPDNTAAAAASPPATGGRPARLTALIVASALFMQNLDSTVVATALPAMARSFGSDPLHMSVAMTAYLLSLAVFIPVSGWMGDRFGARQVFRAAIGVFTLGSILCGAADGLATLVAARIVQGIGGAMMVPVGRLVLLRSVPKNELVAAMAWLTVPALVGPIVGPPLGGLIVTYADWRWIFDINVPIGLLGMVLVTRYVQDVREPSPGRLDVRGLGLSALALASLMFGFETLGRGVVPPWLTLTLLAVGTLAGTGYVWHARRAAAPLLDLRLMRIPTFAISVTAGSLFRVGVGAIPFLLPMMMQVGFGKTAAESGAITFASAVGAMAMKPAAQFTLRQFGFRTVLGWNAALSATMMGAIALMRPDWPVVWIYLVLIVGGFLRSLQFTAYNTIAYADIPREQMSGASSFSSTMQQLSLTAGVTVGAGALEVARAVAGDLSPGPASFGVAFLLVATISLLAAPLAFRLPPAAGAELSGHGGRPA